MTELYSDIAQTCSTCFASVHHYVLADGATYCLDHAPDEAGTA